MGFDRVVWLFSSLGCKRPQIPGWTIAYHLLTFKELSSPPDRKVSIIIPDVARHSDFMYGLAKTLPFY